jgi:outer membrane immunogenic protein
MKKVMVGVAVALAVTTSNAAADGIDRRPSTIMAPQPYIAPPTWTGFYVGAGVGGGAVTHDFSIRDEDLGRSHFDLGGDGVIGTAIIGWDWQVSPNGVLGVFVDYDFASSISNDFSMIDGLMRGSLDHDHSWSVGARLGVLTSPSTLLYATGGFTQARFENRASLTIDDEEFRTSRHRTFDGFFVGAGVDTRLAASNWFLRLEYRFQDFSNERLFRDDFTDIDVDTNIHTARLTLTYKFTGGWASGWGNGWGGWGR